MTLTALPTIIRCSALSGYPDCNRRGAARLFWREITAAGFKLRRTPRGIGAVVGSAVHKAAAVTLDEKATSGSLPPASVATDAALDTLGEELAEGDVAYDGPRGATHNRNDAVRQAIGMTRAYHRLVAPTVEPIIVEERLEAEIVPGLILSGQPDVVAREPHKVRDLKTGARAPGSHAPQIGGYSLLARTHGLDIQEAGIDFIQRVGVNRPQPDPVSTAVAIAQAETAASNIIRHIEGDLATFREGNSVRRILPGDPWAFQANPASILCSPKYCSAFGSDLRLVREPGNAHDENAVAVYADQLHLGFVPRADNVELARAIDARCRFAVRLVDEAVIDPKGAKGGKVVFAPKIEIREA